MKLEDRSGGVEVGEGSVSLEPATEACDGMNQVKAKWFLQLCRSSS